MHSSEHTYRHRCTLPVSCCPLNSLSKKRSSCDKEPWICKSVSQLFLYKLSVSWKQTDAASPISKVGPTSNGSHHLFMTLDIFLKWDRNNGSFNSEILSFNHGTDTSSSETWWIVCLSFHICGTGKEIWLYITGLLLWVTDQSKQNAY